MILYFFKFDFGNLIKDDKESSNKSIVKTSNKEKVLSKKDLEQDLPISRLRAFYNFFFNKDPPHNKIWNKQKIKKALAEYFIKSQSNS